MFCRRIVSPTPAQSLPGLSGILSSSFLVRLFFLPLLRRFQLNEYRCDCPGIHASPCQACQSSYVMDMCELETDQQAKTERHDTDHDVICDINHSFFTNPCLRLPLHLCDQGDDGVNPLAFLCHGEKPSMVVSLHQQVPKDQADEEHQDPDYHVYKHVIHVIAPTPPLMNSSKCTYIVIFSSRKRSRRQGMVLAHPAPDTGSRAPFKKQQRYIEIT